MIRLWNSIALSLVLLLIISSISLWMRAYRQLRARAPLIPYEPGGSRPWGLLDLVIAIVFQLFTIFVASQFLHDMGKIDLAIPLDQLSREQRNLYMAASAIAPFVAFLLTVAWLLIRYRCTAEEIGLQWRRVWSDIRLGFAAFATLAPVVYFIQFVLVMIVKSEHPLIEALKADPNPTLLAWCAFAAVVVAPLGEEFFFRLLLQGWLERLANGKDHPWQILFGGRGALATPVTSSEANELATPAPILDPPTNPTDVQDARDIPLPENPYFSPRFRETSNQSITTPTGWGPIIGSSLLFAMVHFSHGPDPIPLFVFALGLGYLYSRTRRIVPSMVVHLLLNLTTILAQWLSLAQEV